MESCSNSAQQEGWNKENQSNRNRSGGRRQRGLQRLAMLQNARERADKCLLASTCSVEGNMWRLFKTIRLRETYMQYRTLWFLLQLLTWWIIKPSEHITALLERMERQIRKLNWRISHLFAPYTVTQLMHLVCLVFQRKHLCLQSRSRNVLRKGLAVAATHRDFSTTSQHCVEAQSHIPVHLVLLLPT